MNKVFKKKFAKIIIYTIVILILVIIIININVVKDILSIIFGAFILSYALKPFHKALIERGVKESYGALGLILFTIIGVALIITLLVPSVFKESLSLGNYIEELEEYSNSLYNKLRVIGNEEVVFNIIDNIYDKLNSFFMHIFDRLIEITANAGESVLAFVVMPIIAYYFLCDREYIENKILLLCPLNIRKIVKRINRDIDKILGRYIISQFILCAMVSLITLIVLLSLKVKFPIILSLLNGLLNIIPYFGPIFGMVLPVIVALLNSYKTALYTALALYLIQLVEGNILSPKVTGETVSMHPLVVIILLLVGGEIGGFWGMVLAVPMGVVLKVIYDNLNYYLF